MLLAILNGEDYPNGFIVTGPPDKVLLFRDEYHRGQVDIGMDNQGVPDAAFLWARSSVHCFPPLSCRIPDEDIRDMDILLSRCRRFDSLVIKPGEIYFGRPGYFRHVNYEE